MFPATFYKILANFYIETRKLKVHIQLHFINYFCISTIF